MADTVTDSKITNISPPLKPARQPRISLPTNLNFNLNSSPSTNNDRRTISPPSDSESVRVRTLPRLSFSSSSIRKTSSALLRGDYQAEVAGTPSRAPVHISAQKTGPLIEKKGTTSSPSSRMTYLKESSESPKRQSPHSEVTNKRVPLPFLAPSSPLSPRTKAEELVKFSKETEIQWAANERRAEEVRLRRSSDGTKVGNGSGERIEVGATPATPTQKPVTPSSIQTKMTAVKKKRPRQSFPLSGPEFSRNTVSGSGSAKKRPKIVD